MSENTPSQQAVALRVVQPGGVAVPDEKPQTTAWAAPPQQKKKRLNGVTLSFVLLVILPTIAMAVYSIYYATPRYASEFRVMIRDSEPLGGLTGVAQMFGVGESQIGNDANAIVQFLQSREAPEEVLKNIDLYEMYQSETIDVFSRMHSQNSIEALTRHWNRMVKAYYDKATGTIIVQVNAFTPEESHEIATAVLTASDALLNRMTQNIREDSLRFARQEVADAEAKLDANRKAAQALRDRLQILDPLQSAESNLTLAASLQQAIAEKRSQLIAQSQHLDPDAPSIIANKNQLAGLEAELARVNNLNTATDGDGENVPLSAVFAEFQAVMDDAEFAERAYLSTLASLEAARAEVRRKQVYLSVIVPPKVPGESVFPKPIALTASTFAIALAVWMIALMGVYAVREHM